MIVTDLVLASANFQTLRGLSKRELTNGGFRLTNGRRKAQKKEEMNVLSTGK